MARSLQRWTALIVVGGIGCVDIGSYKPRAIGPGEAVAKPGGLDALRFECWEREADCESDAAHRCGSHRGRGFRIVGREELASDAGRKLIVLDVQCTP